MYRYEKSGVVHGLTRVRGHDPGRRAHLLHEGADGRASSRRCSTSCSTCCATTASTTSTSSCRPSRESKAVGTDEEWDEATEALRVAASGKDLDLVLDEGGGAFYGPKISRAGARTRSAARGRCRRSSSTSRRRSASTSHYIGADNERHRPIMIHRALFGSIERFFAVLVEHYAGAFPAWLAPVQATVLPVADRHDAYAFRVVDRLKAEGFRAEMVDGCARRARRAHPPGQDREGAVRPRRRRRRRRARHGRREQAGERRSRARRRASTTSSSGSPPKSPSTCERAA